MIRRLLLCCLVFWLLLSPLVEAASAGTLRYDIAFKRWGQFYFPWYDWRHWKAQGLAESGLNPAAASWCGARGIMQLMPSTARMLGVNPFNSNGNIQGGIKYDRSLYRFWLKVPSGNDRLDFTFASYNAGPGWILKAQKKAAGARQWPPVAQVLRCVTGARNAKQTDDYVQHIKAFYEQIEFQ